MADPAPDARALLREAYEHWAASPAWTLTRADGSGPPVAAVRPGLEWVDVPGGHVTVLVRDGVAHLHGALAVAMLVGPLTDALADDLGEGWVTVPAADWLRRGRQYSALGMFGDDLQSAAVNPDPDDPDDEVSVEDVTPTDAGRRVRVATWAGHVDVVQEPGSQARVVLLDDVVDGESIAGLSLRLEHGDGPLDLPRIAPEQCRPLADLVAAAGGRSGRRSRPSGPTATIEILEPEEPDDQWALHSDDLAAVLGVDAGYEAEALALALLAERVPHLVHLVEGDSYDTVFSAYVPDRQTAEVVAAALRTPHG